MWIDILVLCVVVLAIFKGINRGLIMAVFATLSLFVGLAAATKLSVVIAPYIAKLIPVTAKYFPIITFIAVFIVVILLLRMVAKLLEKTLDVVDAGWLNKLLGVGLFLFIYLAIVSILLFYINKMGFISTEIANSSITYPLIAPWGTFILGKLGQVIPVFAEMFSSLNHYFDKAAQASGTH